MSVLTPLLGHGGLLRPMWGLRVSLGHAGGDLEPIGVLPSSLHWFTSGYNALRRGVKPVRTPVAIFGSPGVCIYGPASRHWLISYSPIHLT